MSPSGSVRLGPPVPTLLMTSGDHVPMVERMGWQKGRAGAGGEGRGGQFFTSIKPEPAFVQKRQLGGTAPSQSTGGGPDDPYGPFQSGMLCFCDSSLLVIFPQPTPSL